MCDLEAVFAAPHHGRGPRRRFRRAPVAMSALIRGDKYNDHVKVTQLGAGGLECRGVPFVEEGSNVEIVIEVDAASYRFSARAVWMRDDGNDYRAAFAFEGIPVLVQGVRAALPSPLQSSNKMMVSIYEQLRAAA
jgi:PilZ domain